MSFLIADHLDLSNREQTSLNTANSAGDTALTVENNSGFTANDYVIVGNVGDGNAELAQISTVSGNTTINVSALKFSHTVDTPITQTPYNQVRFYSSATETGSYTLLTTVAMAVDYPDGTRYNDTSGTSTTWYKVSYFNYQTSSESDLSDPRQPSRSGNALPYSLRGLEDQVITLADDPYEDKTNRNEVDIWINEAYQTAQNRLRRKEQKYAMTTSTGTFVANQAEYVLPSDVYQVFRVDVAMNSSQYRHAIYLDLRDDDPLINNSYSNLVPFFYFIDQSIGFKPTPSNGTYKMWYYPQPYTLTSDGDVLDDPFKSYADMFVDYALYRFYTKEWNSEKRSSHLNSWRERLNECIEDLAGRQINSPQGVMAVDKSYLLSLEDEIYRP